MALLGVDVLLLVLAQAAFNGDSTVDNVVWSIAWLGLLLLIVFGGVTDRLARIVDELGLDVLPLRAQLGGAAERRRRRENPSPRRFRSTCRRWRLPMSWHSSRSSA